VSLPPANWDCFIDDSCVLCLLFEEGEGDTAHDLSRFRNDGTIYGASWVGTPYGRGLSFDGVDDHVVVPDSPELDITDELTLVAIFRLTGDFPPNVQQEIINRRQGSTASKQYGMVVYTDGRLRFHYYSTAWHLTYGPLVRGQEYFLGVVTVDGTDVRVHANLEVWEGTLPEPLSSFPEATINIGYDPVGRYMSGEIVFTQIYNRVLSTDEIRALYQNFRYGLACYKLISQVINPLISDTYERVELIRKIQTNRWKIENNQLIIFDDDGVTPLRVFNLKDKYGNPSEVNVYEREPAE